MRSAGIVLILSGVFIVAAVLHSKLQSPSPASSSPSSSGGSSGAGLVQHITVALPEGGDVTVNASDPAAALENVKQETGQLGTVVLPGVGLIG